MAALTVEFEDGTERTFPHGSTVQSSVAHGIVTIYTYDLATGAYDAETLPMRDVAGWRKEP